MSTYDGTTKPQLRPVEARQVQTEDGQQVALIDPTGLATATITVSEPALFILAHFDGHTTLAEVQESFRERFGQPVGMTALVGIVEGLEEARLLAGESFEHYYRQQVDAYRAAETREMESAADLGLDKDTGEILRALLASSPAPEPIAGEIVGLIAPHLDYPRGAPCYAAAYATLINRPAPRRAVILGTNHFGRARSVVATAKTFSTPLGATACDEAFLQNIERRCGDLRHCELDHRREHSVELQVLLCQHVWGAEAFRIVPVLCPDPCTLGGMDGEGPNVYRFAEALLAAIEEDPDDTVVIAGADLSHVGPEFGDDRTIDAAFAAEVETRDRLALDQVARNDPAAFLRCVSADDNPTRVCSAGCVFTTLAALPHTQGHLLHYHQAIDESGTTGVTCAAAVFTR